MGVDACTGSACSGLPSHLFGFATAAATAAPQPLSPLGASGLSTTPSLSWSAPAGAVAGTTSYTVSIWDPYAPPLGHLLGDIAAGTGLSTTVAAAEILLPGQPYAWSVFACTSGACSGYGAWASFTTGLPAATVSGQPDSLLANPDFSGPAGSSPYGWSLYTSNTGTPTATYASPTLGLTFSGLDAGNQPAALFSLTYTCPPIPSNGPIVYDSTIQVYYTNAAGYSSQVFADQDQDSVVSKTFALSQAYGSGGYFQIQTTWNSAVKYFQNVTPPAARPGPRAGLGAEPRFPTAAGAAAPGSVDVATGALTVGATDLSLASPSGLLSFGRVYDHQGAGQTLFGPKWGSSWDASLATQMVYVPNTPCYQNSGCGGTYAVGGVTLAVPGGGVYQFTAYGSVYVPAAGVVGTLSGGEYLGYGSYVLTTANQRRYSFATLVQGGPALLQSVADRTGNSVSVSYVSYSTYQPGVVISVPNRLTDSNGRWIQLSYTQYVMNGTPYLVYLQDSAGRTVSYGYTASGSAYDPYDLTSVTDVRGQTVHYGYAGHWLTAASDPLGHTVLTVSYDPASGHVARVTDALGTSLSYGYGAGVYAGSTTVTDANGHAWVYYYDGVGRLTDAVDPTAVQTHWRYDASNNVTSTSTSGGGLSAGQQVASYDGAGNRLTLTDAWNYTTTNTYDSKNDLLTVTDPLGHVITQTYDANGNLQMITDPLGHTTTLTVNSHGQVTATQNANGHIVTSAYNATSGDPSASTDALSHTVSDITDALGRVTSTTDPLGHTGTSTYDAAGHVLTATDALNHSGSTIYNADGWKTSATDANNHTTTFDYDNRGELTTITDALAHVTTYGYDAAGNRTSVTDANNHATTYTYDAAGRSLTVVDPRGRTQLHMTYDALGRMATSTDARGVSTSYAYTRRGALAGVSYTVDALGERIAMVDGTGTTTYSYDADYRPTQVVNGAGKVVGYGYDAAGNRTSLTYPNSQTVTETYDADERLSSVTDWLGNTTSYAYTAAGTLATITLPASTGVVATYSDDATNSLVSISDVKGSTTLYSATYSYDAAGNRISKQDPNGTETYTLNSGNQLTQAAYPDGSTQSYTYDAVGNRTQLQTSGGSAPGATTYSYDAADQLTTAGGTAYGYDASGNTTTRGADTLSWDAGNRLTGGTLAGQSFSAQYSGDGLRVQRQAGATSTQYVWDPWMTIPGVLDDGSQYLYGIGLLGTIQSGSAYYYLPDGLGSIVATIDAHGTVVQQATYDAYGVTKSTSGSQTASHGYAGQQVDPSGLLYMKDRYYDPAVGRFLTRDPSPACTADPATHQPYAYAGDNPSSGIDPTGDCSVSVHVGDVANYGGNKFGHVYISACDTSGCTYWEGCPTDDTIPILKEDGGTLIVQNGVPKSAATCRHDDKDHGPSQLVSSDDLTPQAILSGQIQDCNTDGTIAKLNGAGQKLIDYIGNTVHYSLGIGATPLNSNSVAFTILMESGLPLLSVTNDPYSLPPGYQYPGWGRDLLDERKSGGFALQRWIFWDLPGWLC